MKNKWYHSMVCKGILVVLELILAVLIVISVMWIGTYAGVKYLNPAKAVPKQYEETVSFEKDMFYATLSAVTFLDKEEKFETDGKYDENKLIDILNYNSGDSSSLQPGAVTYRLADLLKWAKEYTQGNLDRNIVVCQKTDGSYFYYYYDEFARQIESGQLNFLNLDEEYGIDKQSVLYDLKEGYRTGSYDLSYPITDSNANVLYSDCWALTNGIREITSCKPNGADNLLSIVNSNAELNGKMSDVYSRISETLNALQDDIYSYEAAKSGLDEGNTNFSYLLLDHDAKKAYSNLPEFTDYDAGTANVQKLKQQNEEYVVAEPKLKEFSTTMESTNAAKWNHLLGNHYDNYTFVAGMDTKYPIQDTFREKAVLYEKVMPNLSHIAPVIWGCLVLFIIIFIWLTATAGHVNGYDGIKLSWFDKWKTEIAVAIIIVMWFFAIWFVGIGFNGYFAMYNQTEIVYENGIYYTGMIEQVPVSSIVYMGFGAFATCLVGTIGYLSIVRRLKSKTFWKNSLLYILKNAIKEFWDNRKCTFRTVVGMLGFIFLHYLAISGSSAIAFLCLIADAAAFVYMVRTAIARQRLKDGIFSIADGNLEYQVPTQGLHKDHLAMAEKLNHIGEGLNTAVEASIKNERLKTDLITNVSHDIKTPLTSIINYVDLLKREHFENPKIQNYLDILEKKSQRLKTLTEDVVEASKISSGNIKLEFMNINLVEMVLQTNGEFSEKFENRNLKVILNLPEEPVYIYADGRRMWRVLENLFNNAAKYAMEGTRIYADIKADNLKVEFSLKNISEQPLNISADELTERFIRGDVSRSTEGSGLGLSIAKSLVERQRGKLDLYLDGDLFKATVTFDRVYSK